MELRKRVKLNKLEHNLGLTAAEGRCSRNTQGTERSNATQEGNAGEFSLLRSGSCSGSDILPLWPWRQCVSMAAGLLLAGLLALTQAWCVNAIHENLLWFSELTVGVMILLYFEPFNYRAPHRQTRARCCILWKEFWGSPSVTLWTKSVSKIIFFTWYSWHIDYQWLVLWVIQ